MNAIPLTERRRQYRTIERTALEVAERWFDARAQGKPSDTLDRELDAALQNLLRAKRRLERTERKAA